MTGTRTDAHRSGLIRYGVAVLTITLAAVFRMALVPVLGDRAPFITFFPAVFVASWFGGFGPGIVATVLAAVISTAPLSNAGPWIRLANTRDLLALALFVAVATAISSLSESVLRGRRRERAAREAAERAQTEALDLAQKIRAQRERVGALFAGVPGVVWEAWGAPDSAGQHIDFVSPYVETMLGYTTAEWLGTPNFWLSIVHPDDRDRAAVVAATAFERGEAHTNEFRWVTKDGRAIWVEAHATVMRDAAGRPAGMRGVTFDITSRKDMDRALRQHVEDLTRMQQVSTRLVQASDFSATLQDILEAAIDITGADMGNVQLLEGGVLRIAAHRGLDEQFLQFFEAMGPGHSACGTALALGERVIVEDVATSEIFAGTPALEVMNAAGARALQSTPLVSRSGRLLGMFSTHYREARRRPSDRALRLLDILTRQAADLIEHRQAEEARRLRGAELELLLNQTPFMLTRCTRDLTYRFVSPAYAEMVGRSVRDIVGTPIAEVIGEAGFAAIRPYVERVLHGERVEYEVDVPFEAAGRRALRVVDTPDLDEAGRVQGWIASIVDLTERRRADEARALLANIVNSSEDAILSKNLDGTITSWNAGAERIFGYAAAEAIGRSITLIIPPDRRDEEAETVRRLRQGQQVRHIETERVTKSGRRVSVSLTISPVHGGDGTVVGASTIARDISERVRTDEERRRLLASEQAARAQAEAANRAKDEFLATVSHELRTPLTAILGWGAMLERMAPADARTAKAVQSISRNTRALTQLVDDLLDVSRMIAGKIRLEVGPVDIGDVVDAAVEAVLPAATAKDIELDVSIAAGTRTLAGDAARLQQAVWNLLSNAIKFTPPGGRVQVSTRGVDGEIELVVKDSGIGIEPAFLPYVFDRFRQADPSSTRAHTGLGLGLAIVRHLVELHGGTVQAASDGRDAGTQITMRLPCRHGSFDEPASRSRLATAPIASGARHALPRLDGVRILIVDDDRESGEVMREALLACGAEIQCVASAADAIDALSEARPDVVLSDIAMPGRDGYAVLREVRALEPVFGRRVPVAAVSAYARSEDRDRALAAGFDEYLAKPVDPATLANAAAALATVTNR
jgi:PAS domain S-box-containing protein